MENFSFGLGSVGWTIYFVFFNIQPFDQRVRWAWSIFFFQKYILYTLSIKRATTHAVIIFYYWVSQWDLTLQFPATTYLVTNYYILTMVTLHTLCLCIIQYRKCSAYACPLYVPLPSCHVGEYIGGRTLYTEAAAITNTVRKLAMLPFLHCVRGV